MMTASEGVTSSDAGHVVRALNRIGHIMSNNKSKKNRSQGRPQGFVPARLASIASAVDNGTYRADSMAAAVAFLELSDVRGRDLQQRTKLTKLPIYRMMQGAFREVEPENNLTMEHVEAFEIADLRDQAGVVIWNDDPGAETIGFTWTVGDGMLFVDLLSGRGSDYRNGRHAIVVPDGDWGMAVSLPIVEGEHGMEPSIKRYRLVVQVLRYLSATRDEETIVCAPSAPRDVETAAREAPRADARYEVRSVAEVRKARAGGSHAGSSPSYSFWRSGSTYVTKRGTLVERRGTWCCTDKPARESLERITGTTIRAAA